MIIRRTNQYRGKMIERQLLINIIRANDRKCDQNIYSDFIKISKRKQ